MAIRVFLTLLAPLALMAAASNSFAQEFKSGIEWPKPKVVAPGEKPGDPPSDAIVLIGEDMSAWHGGEKWKIENGVATAAKGGIHTKQKFGDVQLHLEWAAPEKIEGTGQGRGNSGVFLMDKYEIQILDSYDNETYFDGQAGSVYKQSPPMVNAMRKPGEWNTYDIIFNNPVRNEKGDVVAPARITVLHNGVLVQNSYPLRGSTKWHEPPAYEQHGEKESISLQFHGNPVKFRNMWVREIAPIEPTFVPEDTQMKRYVADWRTETMTAAAEEPKPEPAPEGEPAGKDAPEKETAAEVPPQATPEEKPEKGSSDANEQ